VVIDAPPGEARSDSCACANGAGTNTPSAARRDDDVDAGTISTDAELCTAFIEIPFNLNTTGRRTVKCLFHPTTHISSTS
jgi:hypothetical protein